VFVGTGGRTAAQGYSQFAGVRQRFTGKERDTETGLDYFGARYYSSSIGRFTSPDPLYLDMRRLSDPQQSSLHNYARNNPLKYIDPNGLDITVAGSATNEYIKRLQNNVSFQVQLDSTTNKVVIVDKSGQALGKKDLDALGKGLMGGEKELFKAITDTKKHVTIETLQNDSGVFFGAFRGGGKNTLDMSDMKLLDAPKNVGGFSSEQAVGHETLEAYKSAQGKGYNDSHNYANKYFGGLDPATGNGTPIFDAKNANLIGVAADFPVIGKPGVNARVTMHFVTPIPVQSIPNVKPGTQPVHVVDVEKKP
jgi:RHS repeat-associated protein